jgi:hypothetical protein
MVRKDALVCGPTAGYRMYPVYGFWVKMKHLLLPRAFAVARCTISEPRLRGIA